MEDINDEQALLEFESSKTLHASLRKTMMLTKFTSRGVVVSRGEGDLGSPHESELNIERES